MKTIESTFEKYKTIFNLIKRQGNFAIFSREGAEYPLCYEVVEIRSHNGLSFPNKETGITVTTEPAEFYPSNEEWGTKGFSYTKLEEAESRLEKMMEAAKNKLTSKKSELE